MKNVQAPRNESKPLSLLFFYCLFPDSPRVKGSVKISQIQQIAMARRPYWPAAAVVIMLVLLPDTACMSDRTDAGDSPVEALHALPAQPHRRLLHTAQRDRSDGSEAVPACVARLLYANLCMPHRIWRSRCSMVLLKNRATSAFSTRFSMCGWQEGAQGQLQKQCSQEWQTHQQQ